MTRAARLSLFAFLGVFVVFSGCASKKKSQINALQSQVNALTEEVARLDQALQESRGASAIQGSPAAPYEGAGGATYRTPSGFELPSAEIQRALKNAGYYNGSVDGKIGPQTREAVKAFQRDHGLEPDGVVGRRTWSKLKTHLGASIK